MIKIHSPLILEARIQRAVKIILNLRPENKLLCLYKQSEWNCTVTFLSLILLKFVFNMRNV